MWNRMSRATLTAAILGTLIALTSPGVVTAQGPFACTGEAYIVQDSAVAGIDGQLTQIDQSESPFDFVPVGTPQNEYNAIGFNRADGFIYGLELTATPPGNNGVIRIGNDGSVTNLGAPTGSCATSVFPTGGTTARFDAGDVSADGTTLFVNSAGSNRLWILDITTVPPTVVDCPQISGDTGRVNDWAYNEADGNLYGGDRDNSGQVARLELDSFTVGDPTITRNDFNDTGLNFSGTEAFGGAWFDSLGSLFLYRNGGAIFEIIDVTGVSPTMEIVATQSGPGSSRNDGAACAQDVAGAAKEMTTDNSTGVPAGVTIDFVFENFDLAVPMTQISVTEDLAAIFGTHGVDWTFTSASSTPGSFVNPAFNGHAVTELVNQAPTQSIAASSTVTVTVNIQLLTVAADTMGDDDDMFCNQVVLTGVRDPDGAGPLPGTIFGDTSTSGSDPDPDGDGEPSERDQACIMQTPVSLQSFAIE